jgi:hypothetical protein
MIAGDSADWNDFFQQNLIPVVLALVISAWDNMEKPGQTAHEDDISVKLYAALINGKDRSRHMFLIRYEDVEIDTDLAKETGRKDIVFFPANDEDIYFCLEAKRLNALVSGGPESLGGRIREGRHAAVRRRQICPVRPPWRDAGICTGRPDRSRGQKRRGEHPKACYGSPHDHTRQVSSVERPSQRPLSQGNAPSPGPRGGAVSHSSPLCDGRNLRRDQPSG